MSVQNLSKHPYHGQPVRSGPTNLRNENGYTTATLAYGGIKRHPHHYVYRRHANRTHVARLPAVRRSMLSAHACRALAAVASVAAGNHYTIPYSVEAYHTLPITGVRGRCLAVEFFRGYWKRSPEVFGHSGKLLWRHELHMYIYNVRKLFRSQLLQQAHTSKAG